MSSREPLVTVVVATFNAGDLLQGCLDSILAQRAGLAEIIVVDGGSADGTVDVVRRNESAIAFWSTERDRGIADAWNKGIARARGAWILFLGADDRLHDPEVLSRFEPALLAAGDRLLVFGKVVLKGGPWDGQVLGERWRWLKFRLRMTVPHQGAFHNRRLFREYGRFDHVLRMCADYEMLLRPGLALDPVFVDDLVCVMGGDGVSIRSPYETMREARDAQLRHRVAPAPLIEAFHAYARARAMLRRLRAL
jgi:glycosyltransferase involved in cell wall biosynthesis